MSAGTTKPTMRKSKDLTSTQQPRVSVKTFKEAQPKPSYRSEPRKPTPDQVEFRLQALIATDSKESNEPATSIERKVRNVSDITGKNCDEAYFALVDCDMDESQAVQLLVEGNVPVDGEWKTSGGGKKKKQGRGGDGDVIVAPGYEGRAASEGEKKWGTHKAASKWVREGYGGSVVVTEKEGSGRGGGGRGSYWTSRGGNRGNFVSGRGGRMGYWDNPRYGNYGRPGRGKYGYPRGRGDGQFSVSGGGKLESPETEDLKQEGKPVRKGWKETAGWNGIADEARTEKDSDEAKTAPAEERQIIPATQSSLISALPEDPAIISIQMSSKSITAGLMQQRPRRRRVIQRGPSQVPSVPVQMPDTTFDPTLDNEFADISFDCGSRLTPEPAEVIEEIHSPSGDVKLSPSSSETHLQDLSKVSPLSPSLAPHETASPLLPPLPQEIVQPGPKILSPAVHPNPLLVDKLPPAVQSTEPFASSKVSSLSPALIEKDTASQVLSPPIQGPSTPPSAPLALGSSTGMPPAPIAMPEVVTTESASMATQLALSSNTTQTTSVSTLPTATTQSGAAASTRTGSGAGGKHAPPGIHHSATAANPNPNLFLNPYMVGYPQGMGMDFDFLRMQNALSSRENLSISSGAGSFDKGYSRDATAGNPMNQAHLLNMYYPAAAGMYMPPVFSMPPYPPLGFPYQMPPAKGGPSGYHGNAPPFSQTGNLPIPTGFEGEQEFTKGTFVPGTAKSNQSSHRGSLSTVDSYKTTFDGQKSGSYSTANSAVGMGATGVQSAGTGNSLLSGPFPLSGGARGNAYGASGHVGGRGAQPGASKSGGEKYSGGAGSGYGSRDNWQN